MLGTEPRSVSPLYPERKNNGLPFLTLLPMTFLSSSPSPVVSFAQLQPWTPSSIWSGRHPSMLPSLANPWAENSLPHSSSWFLPHLFQVFTQGSCSWWAQPSPCVSYHCSLTLNHHGLHFLSSFHNTYHSEWYSDSVDLEIMLMIITFKIEKFASFIGQT